MHKLNNILLHKIDFYRTALTAVSANPSAETFKYNNWDFNLAEALEDFYKDLKDGKLSVNVDYAC